MSRPIFSYPFAGDYGVTSPYGPREGGMHTGTDFGTPTGTPILSALEGTVKYAAFESGGAGCTVTIEGEDGWQARTHHLSEWVVVSGESVRAGDTIGFADNTGASTGPHLHFEIRSDYGAVTHDPIPILEEDRGHATAPPPLELVTDTGEDTMLIIDRSNGKVALLVGNHRPRLLPSVNDYQRGAFTVLEHDAFEQFFAEQIELFDAATR